MLLLYVCFKSAMRRFDSPTSKWNRDDKETPVSFFSRLLLSAIAILMFITRAGAAPIPVVIDTDIGAYIDDAFALALARRSATSPSEPAASSPKASELGSGTDVCPAKIEPPGTLL